MFRSAALFSSSFWIVLHPHAPRHRFCALEALWRRARQGKCRDSRWRWSTVKRRHVSPRLTTRGRRLELFYIRCPLLISGTVGCTSLLTVQHTTAPSVGSGPGPDTWGRADKCSAAVKRLCAVRGAAGATDDGGASEKTGEIFVCVLQWSR